MGDLGIASLRVVEHTCYGESSRMAHNYKMGRKLIAYNLHRAKPMSFLFELNVTVKSAHQKLNVTKIGRLSIPPMKKSKDRK